MADAAACPRCAAACRICFLHLLTSDREDELGEADCDLAIRFGSGRLLGPRAIKLFDEEVFPVCSAEYLARHPALRDGDLAAADAAPYGRDERVLVYLGKLGRGQRPCRPPRPAAAAVSDLSVAACRRLWLAKAWRWAGAA
ncbi:MAG: LysR substrate-binding domain-containing protein [Aliidongia sp.]